MTSVMSDWEKSPGGPEKGLDPLLLVILGPTASGKSALSLDLARRLGGEIVNCDSMQVVRHLEIGTAKPSAEDRRQVPHHLFDLVEPGETFSAGAYMDAARKVCREIASRGRIPLVTGGTGLYLRALLEGIFAGPGRSDRYRRRIRLVLERKGPQFLHEALRRRDPKAAEGIAPADVVRVIRALEVRYLTGVPISSLRPGRSPLQGFRVVKFGLSPPRQELYARINARVERMFRSGLVEEVRRLLAAGYPPEAKGFEALGYRHAIRVVQGTLGVQEAIVLTQRDTRRYAKRQMTWFRREPDVHWIPRPGEDPEAGRQVEAILRKELLWPNTSQ